MLFVKKTETKTKSKVKINIVKYVDQNTCQKIEKRLRSHQLKLIQNAFISPGMFHHKIFSRFAYLLSFLEKYFQTYLFTRFQLLICQLSKHFPCLHCDTGHRRDTKQTFEKILKILTEAVFKLSDSKKYLFFFRKKWKHVT